MKDFVSRLKSGPSFLLLGQDYLRLETSEDLFLAQILRKYGGDEAKSESYDSLFDTTASEHPEEACAWMAGRCLHFPIPKPLEIIRDYNWSGVFTSAIDVVIDRAFRKEWRTVQPVLDTLYRPSEPRNKLKLHLWHLYGSVTATDEEGRPPLTLEQFWQRQGTATELLNRLPELITKLGILVIEGYSSSRDWLSSQQLFPVLNRLSQGQVHLFSACEELGKDERFHSLIQQGKLEVYGEALAQCLLYASEAGRIQLGERLEESVFGHQIRISKKRQTIPPPLWSEISSTAHVLVETLFLEPSQQSEDKTYADFRHFLFESSYCPPWEGYARGFAFERNFEADLRVDVLRRLQKARLRGAPVLVHGQTGTGKTVALGHLAFTVAKEGRFPVLFIERATSRVKREAIDKFCEWVEDNGAFATLLIWDAMKGIADYQDMLNYLESRGRKVVIVGSTYRLDPADYSDLILFEAPSELDQKEEERFADFISRIDPALNEFLHRQTTGVSGPFLVFLYRLLPPSRVAIRTGMEKELSFVEDQVAAKANTKKVQANVSTLMGKLLQEAGLVPPHCLLSQGHREVAGENLTELQELIGAVMVPGQFNLYCPFELLTRSLDKVVLEDLVDILKAVDIFRWAEDSAGSLFIGPRSSLEAKLIVQQRIGGPSHEIEYGLRLLESAEIESFFQRQELEFVISLIQNLGPNGQKAQYYQSNFPKLAHCLEKLRKERGMVNPRLMLQESMLLRESAKNVDEQSERMEMLQKSEKVAKEALSLLDQGAENRYLKSLILVDLASTYGQISAQASSPRTKLEYTMFAHRECMLAHSLAPQNFYPIDVIAWTARDNLRMLHVDDRERLSIIESVLHAFNLADSEGYSGDSLSRLKSRKVEIFDLLGEVELSDQAFNELVAEGSAMGVYLRASKKAEFIYQKQKFDSTERKRCEEVYSYMIGFDRLVQKDWKSLFLLLKVWWIWKTGMQISSGERTALPFSTEDWLYCRGLITRILDFEEFSAHLKLKYLLGVACFHLRNFGEGFRVFRELETESMSYSKRVFKHHVWSDATGNAVTFTGTVAWINDKGRGELQVHEIRKRIPFLARDTLRPEVNRGDSFDNFRIAFSMIGPLADFRL